MGRWVLRPAVGASAVALGVAVLVTGCGQQEAPTATEPPGASSPARPSSTTSPDDGGSASATPATQPVGVYYVVDTRAGLRLARELHEVATDDPAAAAVVAMVAGAHDPDYATSWNPDTTVLGVTRSGRTVTVDLSADARTANVGSEGAALMIQQLVYTVTEATDEKARVRLLIGGRPAGELWGAVDWSSPVRRADPLTVRQLVQIDTPLDGGSVSSPVTVSGTAATFEANVPWRVLDEQGTVVQTGFATAEEAFTFAPYTFTVALDPGTYTVEVQEDDPSGGEGGPPTVDTRTITVS